MDISIQVNVLTSQACKDRINNIKNTWGKHFNNIVYYADFEELPYIVKCTNISTSYGNEEKQLNRLKQIKNNNNNDWYFFVDDDTFINAKNFANFITTIKDNKKAYGYIIGGWGITYLQGGAGILISKQLLDTINPATLYLRGSTFSDVIFGQILKNNKIELENVDKFYERPPESYNFDILQIKNAITFHQIKSFNSMLNLYEKTYEDNFIFIK